MAVQPSGAADIKLAAGLPVSSIDHSHGLPTQRVLKSLQLRRHSCINKPRSAAMADPELAREVGVKQFATWHNRPMIMVALASGKRYAGNAAGMLQACGAYWASVRAAAQPLFYSSR